MDLLGTAYAEGNELRAKKRVCTQSTWMDHAAQSWTFIWRGDCKASLFGGARVPEWSPRQVSCSLNMGLNLSWQQDSPDVLSELDILHFRHQEPHMFTNRHRWRAANVTRQGLEVTSLDFSSPLSRPVSLVPGWLGVKIEHSIPSCGCSCICLPKRSKNSVRNYLPARAGSHLAALPQKSGSRCQEEVSGWYKGTYQEETLRHH